MGRLNNSFRDAKHRDAFVASLKNYAKSSCKLYYQAAIAVVSSFPYCRSFQRLLLYLLCSPLSQCLVSSGHTSSLGSGAVPDHLQDDAPSSGSPLSGLDSTHRQQIASGAAGKTDRPLHAASRTGRHGRD